MAHALFSPSSAHRWMRCPASIKMSEGIPSETSEFAAEGTVAHEIGYLALLQNRSVDSFIGEKRTVDGYEFTVDKSMADYVQEYVDYVLRLAEGNTLLLEQRLPIGHFTGEEGATGTADAVIIAGSTLHVIDLKFGVGNKVEVEQNEQLQLYGLAALDQYSMVTNFEEVVLHIVQPRVNHIASYELNTYSLELFRRSVEFSAMVCRDAMNDLRIEHFIPGEKQCHWCPAKTICNPLAEHIAATVADDFVDVTQPITKDVLNVERTMDVATLGNLMSAIPLIEDFCKSIRGRVEAELFNGVEVPGFKLVEGRRGTRKWLDDAPVITRLEAVLGDDAFDHTLISPTSAEKLLKGTDVWTDLQAFITQTKGKPSVAPMADKRPALPAEFSHDDFN